MFFHSLPSIPFIATVMAPLRKADLGEVLHLVEGGASCLKA